MSQNSSLMEKALELQREDHIRAGAVSAEIRIDRIDRGLAALLAHKDHLTEALNADFSCRSVDLSMLTDIAAGVGPLKHARKHLRKWMKSEKRQTLFPLNLLGARSRVEFQPLGVVGILSPWNFPVNLTFGPLAGVLAAGNRAMIKPSEFTPATSEVMKEIVREAYDEVEVAIFTGGPEVGQAFSALPFDHMIFTGATSIARHVMAAAAKNLVPVTLELGGKSPVLIGRSADLEVAASRIMLGKLMNAGQVCLAPDYLLVPEESLGAMTEALAESVRQMYPTLIDNDEYTAIVNDRHLVRLNGYLADAKRHGASLIEINPADEDFASTSGESDGQADRAATTHTHRKIAPTLIPDATDDMMVMQEEIFGPILPIRTYRDFDEAIHYVNGKPRALAAYYFGNDSVEERAVIERTTSGGVTINDVIMHILQEDLPFGGVGPSGMGAYHGRDGFITFSHKKAVYKQSRLDIAGLAGLRPPYGKNTKRSIRQQLG